MLKVGCKRACSADTASHESRGSLQQVERHLVHASRRSLVATSAVPSGLKTLYASPIARTEASDGWLFKRASFWDGDGRAGFRVHGPFVSAKPGYA